MASVGLGGGDRLRSCLCGGGTVRDRGDTIHGQVARATGAGGAEGVEELGQVAGGHGVGDADGGGFVVGVAVGAEEEVHQGGDVGVVAGVAVSRVVPVVELGGADQHA